MGNSVGELFFRGGWVMWPLLIFSILTWAVVLERAFVLITARVKYFGLMDKLSKALETGDLSNARQMCQGSQAVVSNVFLGALETAKGKESAMRVTDRNTVRVMAYLKKNLWILGTIASASPFVGLLGTVVGIVRAFHEMAEKGAGGFSVVAGGISEALVATAAGLVVAIVALLTYNMFMTFSNQTMSTLRLGLEEIIDRSFEKGARA
ncbi:MAG: MotA/TolQ/ExbB proton channel family protein [Deltaproteobacteria bacterium]|nr:MotA/TolQ/ExbB proton channel family protein [Deltaproteobacteria bacterium]